MPHIVKKRTDIPDGTLQILDLWPNTSQRNYVIDPAGQTKYLRGFDNEDLTVTGAGPINTTAELKGIQAYLADKVEVGGIGGGGGPSLTPAEAKAAADAIVAAIAAGTSLELATVNGFLPATSELEATTSASTGSLAELLGIISGAQFVLPAGAELEDAGNQFTGDKGELTSGSWRRTVQSGPFELSRLEGSLSKLSAAEFTYKGTAGAAVVLYGDDGAAL